MIVAVSTTVATWVATGQFGDGAFIPLPTGIDEATVYTDEHGEAIFQFNPDVGAELELSDDGQRLCELGEVNGPELLGTATITAEALDPFQLTFDDPRTDTLTKRVFELAGKSLDCVPKTPIEVFCVEVIRDIRGNAVEGATVIFSADPMDRILGAQLEFGGYDTRGAGVLRAERERRGHLHHERARSGWRGHRPDPARARQRGR